jgi:hypothetical protein
MTEAAVYRMATRSIVWPAEDRPLIVIASEPCLADETHLALFLKSANSSALVLTAVELDLQPSEDPPSFRTCTFDQDRVRNLWVRHQSFLTEVPKLEPGMKNAHLPTFLTRLWLMQQRYRLGTSDAGLQGSVPDSVFEVFRRHFGVDHECYANPENVHGDNKYCSPHPDTDKWFGSSGNFVDCCPESGSFELNPPFENFCMMAGISHALHLCRWADAKNLPMSFICVLPARVLDTGPGVHMGSRRIRQLLLENPWYQAHTILPAHTHSYKHSFEPGRRIKAKFGTVLVWIQTDAAAVLWPVTHEAVRAIHAAFA